MNFYYLINSFAVTDTDDAYRSIRPEVTNEMLYDLIIGTTIIISLFLLAILVVLIYSVFFKKSKEE